jgi:hypothetical protein
MDVNIVGDATFIGGKFVILGYKLFFSTSPWNYFLVENKKNMAFHNLERQIEGNKSRRRKKKRKKRKPFKIRKRK